MCLQTMIKACLLLESSSICKELQRACRNGPAGLAPARDTCTLRFRRKAVLGYPWVSSLRSREQKDMRVFLAAVMVLSLSGAAYAQSQSVPKYGDEDKPKS